ncbi:MAG: hypothetical protein IT198_14880 [Acidimicrobiia bacterium]|nr:hypothetical protein [Acidimicrobiia bacterium]
MTWAGPEHNPWMTCVGMAAAMNGLVAGPAPVGPGGIFSLTDPDRHAESIDAHVDRARPNSRRSTSVTTA